jgi:Bacterial Ig domain
MAQNRVHVEKNFFCFYTCVCRRREQAKPTLLRETRLLHMERMKNRSPFPESVDANVVFCAHMPKLHPFEKPIFRPFRLAAAFWLASIFTVLQVGTAFAFNYGDRVQVINGPIWVRTSAGGSWTGYTQPTGSQGTVIGGPTVAQVNGTGTYYTWYDVNFDTGQDGWVAEENQLVLVSAHAPTATKVSPTTNPSISTGSSVNFQINCADQDSNLKEVDWYVGGVFDHATTVSGSSGTASWNRTFSTAGTFTIDAVAVDTTGLIEHGRTFHITPSEFWLGRIQAIFFIASFVAWLVARIYFFHSGDIRRNKPKN